MDRIAVIDMGTNTFHLLIAEGGDPSRIIHRDRIAVRVGKGGITNKTIQPDGFHRALTALKKFRETIDKFGVGKTMAFATSAFRNAANGRELVEQIRRETGIETRVIDGNEEARLIYLGVCAAIDLGKEKSLIVDIGGGSVEFIIGNADNVLWKQSFEIGGQRLLETFQKHDPILESEKNELQAFLNTELRPLAAALQVHKPLDLVGVSGTFDTLSEMYCHRTGMTYAEHDPETPFNIDFFKSIHYDLVSNDRAGRMALPGMIEMRVEMIVVASCLVECLMAMYPFRRIRVSTYSLKEGALATFA